MNVIGVHPCDWHNVDHFIKGEDGTERCFDCGHTACSECGGHGKDARTQTELYGDADPTGTCSLCNGRGVAE